MLDFERAATPDLLTQPYQNVVNVVRRIGLRFVWIDSLCIIQDSSIDWTVEPALMGNVYQDAVITITADAGKEAFAELLSLDGRYGWCQKELLVEEAGLFVRRF